MTTSQLKIENSRDDFEAWVREEFPVWGKYLLWSESLDAYGYSTINLMYLAWQASRDTIVVEIPDYRSADTYQSAGFNEALDECDNIIRAAGIKVKGD